jgi:hypothetical protein
LPGRTDRNRLADVAFPDPGEPGCGEQHRRYLRMIDVLQQGVEAVGSATPTGGRLDETARFFDVIRVEMTTLMQRWREQPQPRRSR